MLSVNKLDSRYGIFSTYYLKIESLNYEWNSVRLLITIESQETALLMVDDALKES